jgi:toxin secretion/phage lysis holin
VDISEMLQMFQSTNNYRVLIVPFALMVFDFITGISHAWATGHLKSYRMREGLNKKVGEITMIIIGCLFNWALNVPKYVIYGIVLYVIIMELISICENLDKMGVPIPKFIKKALRNAEYKIQNDDPNKKDGDAE